MLNYIADIEDYLCKRRGNSKCYKSAAENRNAILFLIHDVLGLTSKEYASIYSSATNIRFRLQKYITGMINIMEAQEKLSLYFCGKSKEQVLAILFPEWGIDEKADTIRKLNQNNGRTIRYLQKTKNDKKKNVIMLAYLKWLMKNVFMLKTRKEIYDFLLYADGVDGKPRLEDYIPAISIIYQNHCCLLDFWFVNLPRDVRKRDLEVYLRRRVRIPENMDVIRASGVLRLLNAG